MSLFLKQEGGVQVADGKPSFSGGEILPQYDWLYDAPAPMDPLVRYVIAPGNESLLVARWCLMQRDLATKLQRSLSIFLGSARFYGLRTTCNRVQSELCLEYHLSASQAAARSLAGWAVMIPGLEDMEAAMARTLANLKGGEPWFIAPLAPLHFWAAVQGLTALQKDFLGADLSLFGPQSVLVQQAPHVVSELGADPSPLAELRNTADPYLWIQSIDYDGTLC